MKLGAEKKGELIALVVLMLVAVVMLWRTFAPDSTPAPSPVANLAPATPTPVPTASTAASAPPSLDPTLHLSKLDALRALDYTGSGRDLFHFGDTPALQQTQAVNKASAIAKNRAPLTPPPPALPPGPPPPPPIPLKFYGFATASGMPERIFLQLGQDNYMVSAGDTIEHRYLIISIGKVSVRVKDLQTQSEQELPLQQG